MSVAYVTCFRLVDTPFLYNFKENLFRGTRIVTNIPFWKKDSYTKVKKKNKLSIVPTQITQIWIYIEVIPSHYEDPWTTLPCSWKYNINLHYDQISKTNFIMTHKKMDLMKKKRNPVLTVVIVQVNFLKFYPANIKFVLVYPTYWYNL